ncbi:Zn(II)2Cys6 transcription factor [Aspergillus affinis]|uniref:Zn(II)2Cys6 transcription factor n=1 Tax=Aspergillus affinis TaxID=1070780 RepID=UPI0022FEB73B|nr:uncharacterized protein KD926_003728 [Aspergillus affinis]KAI9035338.1 hypothetical protein KD926_003728 [Aspergillus affinis]
MTGEILPACDLCYSRKVKCDRQERCSNCADSGVECRRLRPHRPAKPKSLSGVSALEERILNLEKVASSSHRASMSPLSHIHEAEDESHVKRRKLEHNSPHSSTPHGNNESIGGPDDSTHHAKKAKAIIQNELDGSENISRERWITLRSALSVVDRMTKGDINAESEKDLPPEVTSQDPEIVVPNAPPTELLYMLLREPTVTEVPGNRLIWPDHISEQTLEKMTVYLLENETRGQVFHQYCHLANSRKLYEAAAIHSLKQLDILAMPSLALIQALLSAGLLMQSLGRANHSWVLTSYAARLIVSLNYHDISDPSNGEEEVKSSLYWCYYVDRTLSALLIRPPSLPNLQVSPTDLVRMDTSVPYTPLIRIIIDLSQIQDQLLDISLHGKHRSSSQVLAHCQGLQERMCIIHNNLQAGRDSIPELILSDWKSVDFCYYAILVEILRTRLRYAPSPLTHRECLSYARCSLKALQYLQEHVVNELDFAPYPFFLTWTMFMYPLSPFFVLICNIIGTLDKDDYHLICSITQGLAQFTESPYVTKMLNLLASLQQLCEPLFQTVDSQDAPPPRGRRWYPLATATSEPETTVPGHSATAYGTENMSVSSSAAVGAPTELWMQEQYPAEVTPSTEGMMWQLFNSQLSLGLFEPDHLSFGTG